MSCTPPLRPARLPQAYKSNCFLHVHYLQGVWEGGKNWRSYVSSGNAPVIQFGRILHHGGQLGVFRLLQNGALVLLVLHISFCGALFNLDLLRYLPIASLGLVPARGKDPPHSWRERMLSITTSIPTIEDPAERTKLRKWSRRVLSAICTCEMHCSRSALTKAKNFVQPHAWCPSATASL